MAAPLRRPATARVLRAVLRLGADGAAFRLNDLVAAAACSLSTAHRALRQLAAAGAAVATRIDHTPNGLAWRLVDAALLPAPPVAAPRDKLWQTLRLFGRQSQWADTAELAALCRAGRRAVDQMLRRWHRAGYLRSRPAGGPGRALAWRLVVDTGPLPPTARKDGGWHDHNLGLTFHTPAELAAIQARAT
ncbi:MAG: hypothetical protein OHK0024_21180 [Thalassobaculales bacterium]